MTRWEYDTIKVLPGGFLGGKVDEDELRALLNQRGAQGWELVNTFDTSYAQGTSREIILVLKRQLPG